MTPDLTSDIALIRRLLAIFTDYPIRIEPRPNPGQVRWTLQATAADQARMVGKRGSHFYALKLIIAEIGASRDTPYILNRYPEPEPASSSFVHREPRYAADYNTQPALDLLQAILEQTTMGQFALDVSYRTTGTLTFNITPRDLDDYNHLTIAKPDPHSTMTIVGALGTLFRAHAEREGVSIALEVKRPT